MNARRTDLGRSLYDREQSRYIEDAHLIAGHSVESERLEQAEILVRRVLRKRSLGEIEEETIATVFSILSFAQELTRGIPQ